MYFKFCKSKTNSILLSSENIFRKVFARQATATEERRPMNIYWYKAELFDVSSIESAIKRGGYRNLQCESEWQQIYDSVSIQRWSGYVKNSREILFYVKIGKIKPPIYVIRISKFIPQDDGVVSDVTEIKEIKGTTIFQFCLSADFETRFMARFQDSQDFIPFSYRRIIRRAENLVYFPIKVRPRGDYPQKGSQFISRLEEDLIKYMILPATLSILKNAIFKRCEDTFERIHLILWPKGRIPRWVKSPILTVWGFFTRTPFERLLNSLTSLFGASFNPKARPTNLEFDMFKESDEEYLAKICRIENSFDYIRNSIMEDKKRVLMLAGIYLAILTLLVNLIFKLIPILSFLFILF